MNLSRGFFCVVAVVIRFQVSMVTCRIHFACLEFPKQLIVTTSDSSYIIRVIGLLLTSREEETCLGVSNDFQGN